MPTGTGLFPAWLDGNGPGAITLLALVVVVAVAALWIRRLRRTIAAKNARLVGEAERRGAAEDRTRWISDHDVYTGLPRVHHFVDRVNDQLARGGARDKQVVALKLAELDDTIRALGHEAGIGMARRFAERLTSLGLDAYGVTGRDVFLAFGDKAKLDTELRGTLASVDDPLASGVPPWPRVHAGSAACGDCREARELVRRAETALGHAVAGREPWVEWRESLELTADVQLVRVFRETGAEGLRAFFQPQVDVRTGEIVGAEALVRWHAPGIGDVAAAKLVRLLEEAGAIRSLTRRMIREAARVAGALRTRGTACPISVNVAAADLLGGDILDSVLDALRRHDTCARDLKLELTETSFARSPDAIRWVMSRLRDSGLTLAIDDFGTGFSSLAYLNDLPVDEVKIDRSFIAGLPGRERNRSIVRATIAMAHELGLAVVAEGVDDDAVMRILREERCDRAQGFLIAEPLPEAEFLEFVADGRGRALSVRGD
ncbi:MAG TPA: bifunctional diguanylate cyclase/phosphodiesterase [Gammaproteobacteria bacterium]